jgi:hypothetical protein
MRAAVISFTLATCSLACNDTTRKQQPTMTQESIEITLGRALTDGVGPDGIEARVGRGSLINTTRGQDRKVLQAADIRADKTLQPTLPDLARVEHVVYWKTGENDQDVIVTGVYWPGGAEPGVVFRGLIGPP